MEGDDHDEKKRREVSIYENPAVWSEQAEELYMRGEPAEQTSLVGDTHGEDSVFSMSTFSDISGSLKNGMGWLSDQGGDDSYLQQESSIESRPDPMGQTPGETASHQQDQDTTKYEYFNQYNHDQNSKKSRDQNKQSHSKGHQKHLSRINRPWPEFKTKDTPRTPQRSNHHGSEEHLKHQQQQQQAVMTPKTETSNSSETETVLLSAEEDQRCCGIFRRAFEEERVFRRLIHTAVAMLIVFSMLSIYVIVRSSESNRRKAALAVPSPTFSPLKPTLIRQPSAAPVRFPTMEPTRLTATTLKDIILQRFPGAITAVDDPSSAQSRALAWLTSDDSMDAFFITEKLIQRWALAVLYYSTNGDESWRIKDKWLTNHDECEWYTADPYTPTCNEDGMVYSLHLRNNGLRGTLPDELTLLSNSLEFLYLNDGMIEGTIPSSYGKLYKLKRFYLQVNKLSGPVPSEISGMELLENLAIGRNDLTGTIPTDLVLMDELRLVDMSSNQITGSIPTVLGKMSNLASFLLHENKLTGTIPSEFGELPNLISLVVQDNKLEGSVPWQVCEMRSTKTFFWLTVDCDKVTCSDECGCQCD